MNATFLDKVESSISATSPSPASADKRPRMPFTTSYFLSREQEDNLVEHALKRIKEVTEETGRDYVVGNDDCFSPKFSGFNGSHSHEDFFVKRAKYDLVFRNKVDWRQRLAGTIFEQSNLVLPITRRIVKQMIARASGYFFGTDPWFGALPQGIDDATLAGHVQDHARWKLSQCGSKSNKEDALEYAFVLGEAVMKTTHRQDVTLYESRESILVDDNGNPVFDDDGEVITEKNYRPPEDGTPDAPIFQEKLVTRALKRFSGPEAAPVFYKDFLCPLTARDVNSADIVVHLYDESLAALVDRFRKREASVGTAENIAKIRKTMATFLELRENSASAKSAKNREGSTAGDSRPEGDRANICQIAECWLRFDANGDGIEEEVMLILDCATKLPIFYEFTAHCTADGLRPFTVIRPQPVIGRWYGIGAVESFESSQEAVDLLLNRINRAQSESGRITFWNTNATLEGKNDPALKMNWGGTYTLDKDKKAEDAVQVIYLKDISSHDNQALMDIFLQIAMNESGVQHANDANMAGLDQAKLATGIRNIEKSGEELFGYYLSKLESGFHEVLSKELKTLHYYLDADETFSYMAGNTILQQKLPSEKVRDIEMDVKLLLTKYRGQQQLEQASAATAIINEFYALPPHVQSVIAPLYKQRLQALDMKIDVEKLILPTAAGTPETPAAPAEPAALPQTEPPQSGEG